MIINEKNFEMVIDTLLRAATEYRKIGRQDVQGFVVNKEEGKIQVITPFFYIEIGNLKIEMDIPKDKPFYNIALGGWFSLPFNKNIDVYVEAKREKIHIVGETVFSASNIINIINKEKEKSLGRQTRYVFAQGFLPQGSAPVTFTEEGGRKVYNLGGKKLGVSSESQIPEQFIEVGVTYAAIPKQSSEGIVLDVITKFGKVKSGLHVSDTYFNATCLPLLNNMEIIHPDLMECSNVLEKDANFGDIMPPIHCGSMILYDVIKTFLLCKNTRFKLKFQDEINTPFVMVHEPVDADDVFVEIILAPFDQNMKIQRG